MSRVTLAIIAFFGTALILYWQVQQKRGNETDSSLNNQDSPDYIIEDLRSIEFNEQGQVNSRVTAKHMEHYELKAKPISLNLYILFILTKAKHNGRSERIKDNSTKKQARLY